MLRAAAASAACATLSDQHRNTLGRCKHPSSLKAQGIRVVLTSCALCVCEGDAATGRAARALTSRSSSRAKNDTYNSGR
jgi:hypothetical protein